MTAGSPPSNRVEELPTTGGSRRNSRAAAPCNRVAAGRITTADFPLSSKVGAGRRAEAAAVIIEAFPPSSREAPARPEAGPVTTAVSRPSSRVGAPSSRAAAAAVITGASQRNSRVAVEGPQLTTVTCRHSNREAKSSRQAGPSMTGEPPPNSRVRGNDMERTRSISRSWGILPRAVSILLSVLTASVAFAEGGSVLPRLYTDQEYIEQVSAKSSLDTSDIKSVFRFVLGSLPDTVKVYPTENYFYFSFFHGGIKWAGNLRLDIETRDKGKIHITYFKDFTEWQQDPGDYTTVLGAEEGVVVEKVRPLVYRVACEGKSVVFELNDLSGVTPPPGALREEEKYLGPVFDESGIRFFLVFAPREKAFFYILDETIQQADEFYASAVSEEITIGRRTGFAFCKDRFTARRILVGVYGGNTATNNYLDGPFDQLPDNFLKGNELLDAILAVSPELTGALDRFGNSGDGSVRYLIAPYMQYEDESDLALFKECSACEKPQAYYSCLALSPGQESEPPPSKGKRPAPRKKK